MRPRAVLSEYSLFLILFTRYRYMYICMCISYESRFFMVSYPSEIDFISLFECLPEKKNDEELFDYDESTFKFQVNQYKYEVMVCPFYHQFSLIVYETQGNQLIGRYNFQTVSKIEILSDKKDDSSIRLFLEHDRDRFLMVIEITFKPSLKIEIKETFF